MRRSSLVAVAALSGCANILGLDDTSFTVDARIDGPIECDGEPQCVFTTGRTICGVLRQTGTESGAPVRVAAPTGTLCSALGSTEGPCAFTVAAQSVTTYFAGMTGVPGAIDDCGRYVIPDFPAGTADVAVTFTAPSGFKRSATLLFGREVVPGTDRDVDGHVVSEATEMAWTTAMTIPPAMPDVSSGYLVRYTDNGEPEAGVQVAVNGSGALPNDPGNPPWAAYFIGDKELATPDHLVTSTQAHGTALVRVNGTFTLEGFRTGARCKVMNLQQIANTFIFVVAVDC